MEGICLKEPIKKRDIFVRPEVVRFASQYNNNTIYSQAIHESAADEQYRKAAEAFDRQNFDEFLTYFFKAIHSRYDIEKPAAKRLIRRKLGIITTLSNENERLKSRFAPERNISRNWLRNTHCLAKSAKESTWTMLP